MKNLLHVFEFGRSLVEPIRKVLRKVFLLEDRCELGSRQNAGSEVRWAVCEGKERELLMIRGCRNSALTVPE